jgi:hypothetical protein
MAKDPQVETVAQKAQEPKPSWWQTMPGLLTAIAATLTATAGLIATLHQTGLLPAATKTPAPSPVADTAGSPSPSDISPLDGQPNEQPNEQPSESPQALPLADGMEVTLPIGADGTALYKVLSARVEPMNTENLALKLTIRCTNNDLYPINFWNNSFRLLVDGVPRSPINDLNELVEAQSASEGELVFDFPVSTREIILKIGDPGKETTQIPFDLKP